MASRYRCHSTNRSSALTRITREQEKSGKTTSVKSLPACPSIQPLSHTPLHDAKIQFAAGAGVGVRVVTISPIGAQSGPGSRVARHSAVFFSRAASCDMVGGRLVELLYRDFDWTEDRVVAAVGWRGPEVSGSSHLYQAQDWGADLKDDDNDQSSWFEATRS